MKLINKMFVLFCLLQYEFESKEHGEHCPLKFDFFKYIGKHPIKFETTRGV